MKFQKGHIMSQEVRGKISQTMTGKRRNPHSPEAKLKMSLAKRREKHYRWSGGGCRYHRRVGRKVWEKYWNEGRPKGYLIHHVDRDYTNNNIWNLALVNMSHHKIQHNKD